MIESGTKLIYIMLLWGSSVCIKRKTPAPLRFVWIPDRSAQKAVIAA